MSARAIVSGVVYKAPETRTSKTGKPFVFMTIRENVGDATRWWKVFLFSESAIADVMRLAVGEPIAVAGEFDAEIYAPAGSEARVSWKITADAVLSAKRTSKAEKQARIAPEKSKKSNATAAMPLLDRGRPFDDAIPF